MRRFAPLALLLLAAGCTAKAPAQVSKLEARVLDLEAQLKKLKQNQIKLMFQRVGGAVGGSDPGSDTPLPPAGSDTLRARRIELLGKKGQRLFVLSAKKQEERAVLNVEHPGSTEANLELGDATKTRVLLTVTPTGAGFAVQDKPKNQLAMFGTTSGPSPTIMMSTGEDVQVVLTAGGSPSLALTGGSGSLQLTASKTPTVTVTGSKSRVDLSAGERPALTMTGSGSTVRAFLGIGDNDYAALQVFAASGSQQTLVSPNGLQVTGSTGKVEWAAPGQ